MTNKQWKLLKDTKLELPPTKKQKQKTNKNKICLEKKYKNQNKNINFFNLKKNAIKLSI